MSAVRKPKSKETASPDSGVRRVAKGERTRQIGDVTLNEIFPYAKNIAFEKVDKALEAAREKIGVILSVNGQTIMFPGYNDEKKEIPAEKVDEFEEFMKNELGQHNIKVTRKGTEITLTMGHSDNPADDQGYPRRK